MGIPYLQDRSWAHWTRDERFFCAALYEVARPDPASFAELVIRKSKLDLVSFEEWELVYEGAFYRDYLRDCSGYRRQKLLIFYVVLLTKLNEMNVVP